ncbi:MAG: DMT family transporter, partial [Acidobacteria bacterium]|nr:DMT family transporter [Acidobacteriota bacterium]
IISLYPVITVFLSVSTLRERASRRAWLGILLALPAIAMLAYQPAGSAASQTSGGWLVLAILVFAAWGVQAFVMKFSNRSMSAEGIFFYMAATAVVLIPAAVWTTDFSRPINWGFRGPWLAAMVQVLNSIGALCLVFALRYGKAIIVVPMTSLAPVLTIILSLMLYQTIPGAVLVAGMVLASIAIYLMAE